jgi:predicted ATP-grasp superfamily ATP-dependent carboligase
MEKILQISSKSKVRKATAILLIGNYDQTITVIRSLAQAGYHVIVGCEEKRVYTQYSRYTGEVWRHPDIKNSEGDFVAALVKFLTEREDIALIFPIGETDILCLLRHMDAIPSSTKLVMANPATIEACFDKFHIYEIVSQLGIPLVKFRKVSDYAELESAVARFGYPCVVKPNNSQAAFFEMKALILRTASDLKRMLPVWPEGNEFLILQQFASGYRHNCHFIADRGRLLAYFEQRVLRTDELDGTGGGVDGISYAPTAKLRKYCALLAEKLNYSSIGCAQFLVDDQNGTMSFLEINPRLDATCALPFYCGYDFPRMAVLHAEYRRGMLSELPENSSTYPVGKHGVSLWRDVMGWARAVKTGKRNLRESLGWLKQMALTFFHGDFHFTWSWTDPLPTFYRFSKLVPSALNRLARKIGLSWRH